MKRPTRIATEQQQVLSFTRRTLVLGGAQAALGIALAGRMAWLSIAENERYSLLAEDNRVQLLVVPPRRGWIVDRHGKPIAINRTDFRVDLIPDQLENRPATIAQLARLLALPDDEVDRITRELEKAAGYQPVPVAEHLDYDRYAAVSVRLPDLPGVAPQRGYSRFYPDGAAVGHLVGYVGAASAADYEKTRDRLLITPGFKIGKDGLEKVMETRLRGTPGGRRSEVTARGRLVRDLETKPDIPGRTLRLTIDAGLQDYAARRLGGNSGAAVVIDTLNGDILAMASMPSYDPNSFSDGIGINEYKMLNENDHRPLVNKTLQGLYPPGSTVKPMVALALLRAGIDPAQTVTCSGRYQFGSGAFHCWRRGGHGTVDMGRAIYQSCDIYFYKLAQEIGIDAIATMARELGLGQEFPLPVASQRYGTVPDSAWKQRKYKEPWQVYDTINATIGQGYMLSNPLQLAVMAARIASGRQLMPRLVIDGAHVHGPSLDIAPEHLEVVRQAMSDVVNRPGGTAGRARLPIDGVLMAGKTGTAQVRRITTAERRRGGSFGGAGVPWKYRDHALFVAFAPVANPRYAAAVVIEHGISGSGTASPIAKDILTYLYDPAAAMRTLTALEASWGGDIATRMKAEADAYSLASAAPSPANRATPPPPASAPVEATLTEPTD